MNTKELQEQIQEDMIAYFDHPVRARYMDCDVSLDALCQIVVDNFKKLDDEPEEIITEGDKKLKAYLANQKFFNDTYNTEGC
jgi:hypothetical protein